VSRDGHLDAVCREQYPRLVGLLALQVGDRDVAEELAQDALAEFVRHHATVEDPSRWLTRVALNLSRSRLRRRSAERRAYRRHGPTDTIHVDAEAADVVHVRRLVAALPLRQRTAVVLRFFEQYSVADTAAVMGCAEGTVKALTHQAMSRLRVEMPEHAAEVTDHA
jgi:RNA polymerase sigma factor (sigma-70 family)